MVNEFLQKILTKRRDKSEEPWAAFEILGFEQDGRIKVTTSWNKAFINKIHELGFHAETEDDSVQLFFYTAQSRPTSMNGAEEDPAVSTGHPNLQSDTHSLRT